MDKAFKEIQSILAVNRFLEQINQVTDDFLYLYDIENSQIRFFAPLSDAFAPGTNDDTTYSFEELLAIIHPADRKKVSQDIEEISSGKRHTHDLDFRIVNKHGEIVWVNSRGNLIRDEDGKPSVMLGRLSEEAVRHLFNPLTGLWNLTKLREDLKTRLSAGHGWLMLLKVPMLTDINLSHGKGVGNQLICDIAAMLEEIDCTEMAYHIDSNQFAVVFGDVSEQMTEVIYQQICGVFQERCMLFAGVVPIDQNVFIDVSQLIDSAKITLNKAAQNPGEGIVFFSAEEIQQRISALLLLEEMKASVQNGFAGFEVLYQPQIKSESYELYGVEALLRYHSPNRGRVFPDEFIPLLENSGLIDSVGMWVLDTALAQCKKWREYLPDLQVSVNFSSVQFEDRRLGEKIVYALERAQLPGNALTVELTESVQLNDKKHYSEQIKYITAHGVRFSIDDFGTGYSNLGYLKQLNVNEIKIDRSFISEIEKNTYNYRLISNIIEFAKTNSIHACCEGVETAKELSVLETLQADFFQGYLFDKPCDVDEIAQKYIHTSSDGYVARMAAIDDIHRFKAQFGSVHFDAQNILRANEIGLWILRFYKKTGRGDLHVNDVMEHTLGLSQKLTPKECYAYWHDRIPAVEVERVEHAMKMMRNSGNAVQLEYRWNHPVLGEVNVRSSGIRTYDTPDSVIVEGYHRILTGVEGT